MAPISWQLDIFCSQPQLKRHVKKEEAFARQTNKQEWAEKQKPRSSPKQAGEADGEKKNSSTRTNEKTCSFMIKPVFLHV
jgi:hypothetical protein